MWGEFCDDDEKDILRKQELNLISLKADLAIQGVVSIQFKEQLIDMYANTIKEIARLETYND